MPLLKQTQLWSMITRCNRCGFCQDVCPTYSGSFNEFAVARGRIRMMRMILENDYNIVADKAILDQVDQCLLCRACVEHCPSNVPTDDIMRLARQKILKQKGFSLFHNLLYRGVLTRQERLEKVSALIRLLDRTKLRSQVAKTAAKKALHVLSDAMGYLPPVMEMPLAKSLKQSENQNADILYFLGCGTNVFTPKSGKATIACLKTLGFSVTVIRKYCCGGPHFAAGDIQKARTLARENIAAMRVKNYHAIVSDCATCTHTLHDYASFFQKNDPLQATIEALKDKITDINTFVLGQINGVDLNRETQFSQTVKVTYHDPCHAVRGMGVKNAPRQILQAIPGISFVEMENADSCCGGAGSFSFRQPEMSKRILDRKIAAIKKSGAQIVATSCPSCILQLGAGLRRHQLDIRVAHPMDLLSNCWQATDVRKKGKQTHMK